MNNEEKGNSVEPEDLPSAGKGSEQDVAELPETGPEDTSPAVQEPVKRRPWSDRPRWLQDGSPCVFSRTYATNGRSGFTRCRETCLREQAPQLL